MGVEEKFRKLDPLGLADKAWLFYLSNEKREEAEDLIDILLHQRAGKDFRRRVWLDPPSASACYGEYQLGNVFYPPDRKYCSFGLREDEWIKHVLIVGMTGVGKTNLAFHILRELKKKEKPFLVFDWKKNYRDLHQLPEFKSLRVFRVAEFLFNPLVAPPGTLPGEWLMKLVDVLKHAYFVGEGVEFLLREAIDWAYTKSGYYDGGEAPNFYLVKHYLHKKRVQGRMGLWKASAMRVLESLCFPHGLGPVVNSAGFDEKLLDSGVVLELDALSDSDKVFLVEALILWLYEYRKNEGKREEFKHALVIEEGHHVLSREKERATGVETIMETSLRQIREFGEAVIVIDQEPTKLSNSIKANTYTKIVFNLGNGKDIEEITKSAGLTLEETKYVNLLNVGEAIISLKGRVKEPLHIKFPRVPVVKGLK